jgi:hypothetical protein
MLSSGGVSRASGVHEAGPFGSSASLGLVYRVDGEGPPIAPTPVAGQPPLITRYEDTLIVMRWNYDARDVDTVARLGTGHPYIRLQSADSSRTTSARPLYLFADGAAVTTDGFVALFHSREYRVDWVGPDGKIVTGPRLSFEWHRITDDERAHLIDSINTTSQRRVDSLLAKRAADSARTGSPPMTTAYYADGTQRQIPTRPPTLPAPVSAEDVPDFLPPSASSNMVWADGDSHIWIRRFAPPEDRTSPVLWDVVDRVRGVIDRVTIPAEQTLVGFGPGGVVYTTSTDAGKVALLKSRIR